MALNPSKPYLKIKAGALHVTEPCCGTMRGPGPIYCNVC